MEKLSYIESNINYISINYHIVRGCNFKCDYCSDKESRDGKYISSIKDFDDFVSFISKLDEINSQTHIEITLIGGEPLIHKDIFYLIDKLYKLSLNKNNNVKIIIATNGFLINKFSNNLLKYSGNDFLKLNISYHFNESKKYDLSKKIFYSTINFLKNDNIYFTLIFLLPTKNEELEIIKNIISDLQIGKNNLALDLIRFGGKITDYDREILDFYNDFYKSINTESNENKYLNTIIDGKKELLTKEELFTRKLNLFKSFKCYPFRVNTFLNIHPNMESFFVGCRTLNNQKYSLDELINIFKDEKSDVKYVNCIDEVCDCCSAFGIKKEFDNTNINFSNLLFQKLSSYFRNSKILFKNIEYLNNNSGSVFIEISFEYKEKSIIFVVEELKNTKDYMYVSGILGLYWYAKDEQYEFIKGDILNRDLIENAVTIIKKSFPIFELIINKGKKQ